MIKRSYVLLEVIIAIALVALVGFLLIRAPMKSVYKEWEMVVDMERARLWNNFLIEFETVIMPGRLTEASTTRIGAKIEEEPLDIKMGEKLFKKTQCYLVWWYLKTIDKTIYYDVHLEELQGNQKGEEKKEKIHHFFYEKKPPKEVVQGIVPAQG